jgi:hypothetical protein
MYLSEKEVFNAFNPADYPHFKFMTTNPRWALRIAWNPTADP